MNKVVVITGAAGGIGGATVDAFADAGWQVVGIDLREAHHPCENVRYIQSDISCPHALQTIFDNICRHEGHIEALVNNAALQICKPLLETTPEEWDAVMDANLRSVFLAIRHTVPMMKESGGGSIVNVSSVHAIATSKNIAAYAASKGALLAFTRAAALEFGQDNIRVNAILPGAIDTPMLHAGLSRGHVNGDNIDELVRGLGHKHVMGRVGQPQEIGKAILFLADPVQSSFMTGQALVVDGGATARLSTE